MNSIIITLNNIKLRTDTRVCPCDDYDLIRKIVTLQDLQRSSISIIALRLHLHVLYSEGLPRVKVRLSLIDMAER